MPRTHTHQITLHAAPERVFEALHTPSAIRAWWGASHAVVLPRPGGAWSAAWGDEDAPDYVSAAVLQVFDPPRRLVFASNQYYAKAGQPPFEMEPGSTTEFTVEPHGSGSLLRVVQTGFPDDPIADDFYAACEVGWKNTFDGIRRYLEGEPAAT